MEATQRMFYPWFLQVNVKMREMLVFDIWLSNDPVLLKNCILTFSTTGRCWENLALIPVIIHITFLSPHMMKYCVLSSARMIWFEMWHLVSKYS